MNSTHICCAPRKSTIRCEHDLYLRSRLWATKYKWNKKFLKFRSGDKMLLYLPGRWTFLDTINVLFNEPRRLVSSPFQLEPIFLSPRLFPYPVFCLIIQFPHIHYGKCYSSNQRKYCPNFFVSCLVGKHMQPHLASAPGITFWVSGGAIYRIVTVCCSIQRRRCCCSLKVWYSLSRLFRSGDKTVFLLFFFLTKKAFVF